MKTQHQRTIHPSPESGRSPDVLLTEREACEYLHVSRSTLIRHRLSGSVPWINLGRGQRCIIRFRKRDLDAYLERCTMNPLEVCHA